MVQVNGAAEKVYSSDGKLWVGMTDKDAYNDEAVFEIFNFADKNGDKVIDEAEIRRYNAPRTVIANGDGNEYEFYPGQKLEEVAGNDCNLAFRDLDLNLDGELSSEEIQKFSVYTDRKNKYQQKYKEINAENEGKRCTNVLRMMLGAIIGAYAGGRGGFHIGDRATDAMYYSKFRLISDYCSGSGAHLLITCVSIMGGLFGGYKLVQKLLCKEIIPPEEQLKEETEALKLLDEQYKHVCVS